MKSRLIQYIADTLRSPRDSLTRGQHFVRHSIELTVHCWRQLRRHRAEGMAAELTYRTIFSLIPVVVLGLVMFRVFGGLDEVQSQVENQLYSFFGVPEIAEGYERTAEDLESQEESATNDLDPAGANGIPDSDGMLQPNVIGEQEDDDVVGPDAMVPDAMVPDAMVPDAMVPDAMVLGNKVEPSSDVGDQDADARDAGLDDATPKDSSKPTDSESEKTQSMEMQSQELGSTDASGEDAEGSVAGESQIETDAQVDTEGQVDNAATGDAAAEADEESSNATSEADRDAIARAKAQAEATAVQKTRASIRSTLHDVTTQVSQVDFKSIGVFGLLLFIYAAVALADSTEEVFNRIYDASSHRPIHLRFAIHWSIITVGSGLLAMSLYLSGQVVDWLSEISVVSNFQYLLNHLLSITASWVLLFLLYALMPNTYVSVPAAAIGSLVGALLWEAAKFGFQIYVVTAVPYSAIYGSIGLIPLFLFWIYVTWLIVLFGLILTYTLQVLQGRSLGDVEVEDSTRVSTGDPDWFLPITWEVSRAFESGETIDDQTLAERLGLPPHVVRQMTGQLSEAGLLRRVLAGSGEHEALTLARPAEKIHVSELLKLAHQRKGTNQHPAWRTLAELKQAERAAAADTTIKDVMAESSDSEPTSESAAAI